MLAAQGDPLARPVATAAAAVEWSAEELLLLTVEQLAQLRKVTIPVNATTVVTHAVTHVTVSHSPAPAAGNGTAAHSDVALYLNSQVIVHTAGGTSVRASRGANGTLVSTSNNSSSTAWNQELGRIKAHGTSGYAEAAPSRATLIDRRAPRPRAPRWGAPSGVGLTCTTRPTVDGCVRAVFRR